MEIKEGYMPFMGYQTYYRIVGKTEEGKSPIILLHGGPGYRDEDCRCWLLDSSSC